jgi:YidC/Oxa1 family membrane protein insertase
MDTKKMIVGIVLITAVGLGYQYFLMYEYSKHPEWKRPGDQSSTTAPSIIASSQPSLIEPATGPTTQSAVGIVATTQTSPVAIGSPEFKDARYHLDLSIVPPGAGLDSVVLNEFRQEVDSKELFTYQTPYDQAPDQTRSLATTAVILDGNRIETWDKNWASAGQTDHSARYTLDLAEAGAPAVRVSKEYVLEQALADPTTAQGYEVAVNYSLVNLSRAKHTVALEFNGPTVPKAETTRQEPAIVAGYDDQSSLKLDDQYLSKFSSSNPSRDFAQNPDNLRLLWLGATSTYFNAVVRPIDDLRFIKAVAQAINPESPASQRLVAIRFTSQDVALPPGGQADLPMRVFFGPKSRALLGSAYYRSFPLSYDHTEVLNTSWICGLCTLPWLISFLVMVLAGLHFILRDWGLAIIALVCGVRILLHPITKKSQVSMMKMQKLAPEMERLKKKFGDDKEGFTKAQMELYKSVGFTPVLGCLPMFLQMPIFIALWQALLTTFELRQAPFHFTWIHDLSQPDFLVKFAHPFLLPFGLSMAGINILPIAMAVVTFINQKYFAPKPAVMTPEQEQQQKMMAMMTPIFPILFYTLPSGLNLYYLTSTTLGILESKRIRDHIKQADAEQAAKGPVVVDAGKASRTRRRAAELPAAPKKKGWLAKLQEQAEQMAREAEKRKRKS